MDPKEILERIKLGEELDTGRRRELTGTANLFVCAIGIAMVLFQIGALLFWPIDPWLLRAIHLLFASSLGFLLIPARKASISKITPLDILFILINLATVVYIYVEFDTLILRAGAMPAQMDLVFGLLAVIVLIEMTRRTSGLSLPITAMIFVLYALMGPYLPGLLWHKGYGIDRILSYLYSLEGIYGLPLNASAVYVFLFVLFGAFLTSSGATDFFINLALSIAGNRRGGPAKVSIITSSLFGTVSGSSVANVVVDGVINIPMMKATGFKSDVAGAVEAMTSTGGQIVPPVMGVAAFVMAQILGVPYSKIAICAIGPAIVYYVAAYWMIDFEAAKLGLKGIAKDELPDFRLIIKRQGHLLLPILLLIGSLMVLEISPVKAAVWAIVATIGISYIRKSTSLTPRKVLDAMSAGAQGSIDIATTCACSGIIVGMLTLTGLGLKFATIVISYSGGSKLLALFLSMIVTLILGMGMPTVAAYVISASVIAPALRELGIPALVAHFFIFYFACISAITPPVAVAAYAAAAIAKANTWQVGLKATKLGIAGFVIPFMFVYGPALLFLGEVSSIILALITASIGSLCLAAAVQGWLFKEAKLFGRVALFIAALLLIKPGIITDIIGLLILIAVGYLQKRGVPRSLTRR